MRMQRLSYAEASEANELLPPSHADASDLSAEHEPLLAASEGNIVPWRETTPAPRSTGTLPWYAKQKIKIFLTLNVLFAGMCVPYILAKAHPLPRGVITWTWRRFATFEGLLIKASIMIRTMNLFVTLALCAQASYDHYTKLKWYGKFAFVAGTVTFVLMGLMWPLFVITVVPWELQTKSFAQACDKDWIEILLEGHTSSHHDLDRNIATFKLVETGETLFIFTSQDPVEEQFNFFTSHSPTSPSVLPSLSTITIDHSTNQITGTCYGSGQECLSGYVWPYNGLFFELRVNGTMSRTRNRYHDWSWGNAPSVILHSVDANDWLGDRILQISVAPYEPCEYLKLCVSQEVRQRSGNVLPSDILVSAGWLLHKFARYTLTCSKHSTS